MCHAQGLGAVPYTSVMKKIVLAVALLLSVAGASGPIQRFMDPLPICPPACDESGNFMSMAR
jgi:hypothetical protein